MVVLIQKSEYILINRKKLTRRRTKFSGRREAKQLIRERTPPFTKKLAVRIMVGSILGHCTLGRYYYILLAWQKKLYAGSVKKTETTEHIICQCEGLVRLKFLLVEETPPAERYVRGPLSRLKNLIKEAVLIDLL